MNVKNRIGNRICNSDELVKSLKMGRESKKLSRQDGTRLKNLEE